MFLLIHELESNLTLVNLFTFHNVSINSICLQKESEQYLDLHSTMFLLIRAESAVICGTVRFTFHNVSINSYL